MRFKPLLVWSLCALPVLADLQVEMAVKDVFHQGAQETVNPIEVTVTADDFADASPAEPIFLHFVFDQSAVLGQTLVDLTSADPNLNRPIDLALSLDSNDSSQMAAASDAVSIVRWVAGEPGIWVRIQQSSATWIRQNNVMLPPGEGRRVSFTFGNSASLSYAFNSALWPLAANLPANSYPSASPGTNSAVSTLLCLDLQTSTLGTGPDDNILDLTVSAYGSDAQVSEDVYQTQKPLPLTISGPLEAAIGKRRACTLASSSDPYFPMPLGDGLVQTSSRHYFFYGCREGEDSLSLPFEAGTSVEIALPEGPYGFRMDQSNCVLTSVEAVPIEESAFELEGLQLYKRLLLVPNPMFPRLDSWQGCLNVVSDYNGEGDAFFPSQELTIEATLNVVSGAEPTGQAPFARPYQAEACAQTHFRTEPFDTAFHLYPVFPETKLLDTTHTFARGRWESSVIFSDHLFIFSEYGTTVMDVSNPEAPRPKSFLQDRFIQPPLTIAQEGALICAQVGPLQCATLGPDGNLEIGPVFDRDFASLELDQGKLYTGNRVWDVRDVQNPILIAEPQTVFSADDVEGNLIVARTGTNIILVDNQDPGNPTELTRYPLATIGGVQIMGNRLYASSQSNLVTLDISDPSNPMELGRQTMDLFRGRLTRVGDRLFAHGQKIFVYDLSDPDQPALLGQTNSSYEGLDLAFSEAMIVGVEPTQVAYTALGAGSFNLSPRLFSGADDPFQVAFSSSRAVMGALLHPYLDLVDLTAAGPNNWGQIQVGANLLAPALFDDQLAFFDDGQFKRYDISNVHAPIETFSTPSPLAFVAVDMALSETHTYVVTSEALSTYTRDDHTLVSSIPNSTLEIGFPESLLIKGSYLLLGSQSGLALLEISNGVPVREALVGDLSALWGELLGDRIILGGQFLENARRNDPSNTIERMPILNWHPMAAHGDRLWQSTNDGYLQSFRLDNQDQLRHEAFSTNQPLTHIDKIATADGLFAYGYDSAVEFITQTRICEPTVNLLRANWPQTTILHLIQAIDNRCP